MSETNRRQKQISEEDFYKWKNNKVTIELFKKLKILKEGCEKELLYEGNLMYKNDHEKKYAYAYGMINGLNISLTADLIGKIEDEDQEDE